MNTVHTDGMVGFMVPTDLIDEKPGFMDILADGEGAFERVLKVIDEANQIMNETTAIAVASTAELNAVDAQSAPSLRSRLGVVARHSEALKPFADRFDELSQTYIAEWRDIQSAIEYLVREIEKSQDAREAAVKTNFPGSVSTFSQSVVQAAAQLGELAKTLDKNGESSRILRPVTNRMATALRRWAEPVPVAKDWQVRLDRLGI
jgi:hypothetical protein